ncbi:hypothetical protein C7Y70_19440 [Pseudoalteromonas sp. KS88]|uniref:RHS repeat domain-containing protein n=1 Tax=Pseudoalteromonas sp. KS88 TaxID=2109918 RepID=UPI00107FDBE3|nr:RHS repeat-associated core domain-containing protein [Pseudoalteromonas sp. KS88]TGE76344.1 hypothetical protein C7Y70_19440 [Pseudoalteromonas sp. KS88]
MILKEERWNENKQDTHLKFLGSARVFTDHNGQVEAVRNFDPFGKPRLANGGLKPYGNSKLGDLENAKTRRGFTDLEHLDNVELIHMNGREYDYNLGRFMSVDPVIQSPTNSQSINPYSYIMNNPLSGTDPTGYTAECNGSGVCDIGNIKMDDVENVQVTKDGNMVVNTKDGNSYQVESINGADVGGKFSVGNNSPMDINSQQQNAKNDPLAQNISNYAKKNEYSTKAKSVYSDIPADESNMVANI